MSLLEIIKFGRRFIKSFQIKLQYSFTLFTNGAFIPISVSIHWAANAKFCLGGGSRIGKHSVIDFSDNSELFIGSNTHIGHFANIRAGSKIQIGSDCRIAQFVSFIGDNHIFSDIDIPMYRQGVQPDDIIIEDDVWIGTHVVVLPGVKIGKGAIIGAGSIITRDIDEYSIAVGNPAKVIKKRSE